MPNARNPIVAATPYVCVYEHIIARRYILKTNVWVSITAIRTNVNSTMVLLSQLITDPWMYDWRTRIYLCAGVWSEIILLIFWVKRLEAKRFDLR